MFFWRLFPEPHGFYRTDRMGGYTQGLLDFGKLRFRGCASADFQDVPVVLLGHHRDALLGAHDAEPFLPPDGDSLPFQHVLGRGEDPVAKCFRRICLKHLLYHIDTQYFPFDARIPSHIVFRRPVMIERWIYRSARSCMAVMKMAPFFEGRRCDGMILNWSRFRHR